MLDTWRNFDCSRLSEYFTVLSFLCKLVMLSDENGRPYTQESVFISLPEDLITSLTNGKFILPKSDKQADRRLSDSSDEDWSDDSDEDINVADKERPEFSQFEHQVKNIIRRLGGVVFPKLNWSAPNDASWMSCDNSLRCKTFSDIYLLLKSSDFAAHDLTAPFALCADTSIEQTCCLFNSKPILVLRRWYDFRPEGNSGASLNLKFLLLYVNGNMMRTLNQSKDNQFKLENYTVDLYREPSKDDRARIQIIDFNVFGPPTDALLYQWSELENVIADENESSPLFRYQSDQNIHPNSMNQYGLPIDLIDIASGSDPQKLMDFIQARVESQKNT
ncbi:unnamed protein product [Heterobilharzia americana]|nr:unnamed protein product [Heterobilharzia americana]